MDGSARDAEVSTPPSSSPGRAHGHASRIAILCFVLSGYLALTYEICWIRKASLTTGATTLALSTVLAVFFGGLAFGSYVFGRLSGRFERPVRVYALLEIGVGVLALATPWSFSLIDRAFGLLYNSIYQSFAWLSALRCVLIAAVLLPPTLLMGGTLPLFCRQFVERERHISRAVGVLYALNTLGAAAGAAVCGFLLIPRVGVDATLLFAGAANVGVGAVAWCLRLPRPVTVDPPAQGALPSGSGGRPGDGTADGWGGVARVMAVLFFFSGFVALGNEIVWTRYLSLLLHNTVYTYTLTLTVTLVGIVIGSLLAAHVFDRFARRGLAFGVIQFAAGLVTLAVMMLPAPTWERWLDATEVAVQAMIVFALLSGPAILSGMTFPLAIRMVVHRPEYAGPGVGWMTALNTLGGILGSLTVAFVLLPVIGLHSSVLLTSGLSFVLGCVAWQRLDTSMKPRVRYLGMALWASVWVAIPMATDTWLPRDFLASGRDLIDFEEGVNAHMSIVRAPDGRIVLEVDRLWQGEDRKTQQVMAAHVPMLLHPDPKRVAVVGLGVGQTASRFLMYPIDRLDCIEIEGDMIPLIRRHFDSRWMEDPRVRFVIEDGRNYLSHTNEFYDLISIEVGQVFRPGIASFYTFEFYLRARERLTRNGMLSQMLPIAFFDEADFRTVVRTFAEAFPESVLWYNREELLLIGVRDGRLEISPHRLRLLRSSAPIRRDLDFSFWGGPEHHLNRHEVFLAGFLVGPTELPQIASAGAVYHDRRPFLEYTTPLHRSSVASRRAILAVVRAALSPVAEILADPPAPRAIDASDEVRDLNLRNIVADALLERFFALDTDEQRSTALPLLRQAREWNPSNARVNMVLGLASYKYASARAEAVGHLEEALRIRPDYVEAHFNLGYVHMDGGELERAVHHYRRALEHDPAFASARYQLGVVLLRQGNAADAERCFRQLLEAGPKTVDALHQLGRALLLQGRFGQASDVLAEALALAPGRADVRQTLGEADALAR